MSYVVYKKRNLHESQNFSFHFYFALFKKNYMMTILIRQLNYIKHWDENRSVYSKIQVCRNKTKPHGGSTHLW